MDGCRRPAAASPNKSFMLNGIMSVYPASRYSDLLQPHHGTKWECVLIRREEVFHSHLKKMYFASRYFLVNGCDLTWCDILRR
jgi:hypothetical protein